MSTKREWKPGDVALNPTHGYRSIFVKCCRINEHGRNGDPCWHNESGLSDPANSPRRPLVVVDPEDREQVEAFTHLFLSHHWSDSDAQTHTDAGQAALREFANPQQPKPEEPTGLGAVVEDEDGSLLIRNAPTGSRPWVTMHGATFDWADIDVARILSEGVQP